jgi:hypothetical protein
VKREASLRQGDGACYCGCRIAALHASRGGTVPDSFGKRNREKVKAKKAEARDDRRIARNQRRKGILPPLEHFQSADTDQDQPIDQDAAAGGEVEADTPEN